MLNPIFGLAFAIVWLSFISPVASNQQIRHQIAVCAQYQGDLDRLACFDGLARRHGLDRPQQQQVEAQGVGKWRIAKDINPIDDSVRVFLYLDADSGVSRRGNPIRMTARCQSNTTELYINWGTFVGDDSRDVYQEWKYVTVRIGDGQSERQRWTVSTSRDATFAPRWAGTLLKRMTRTDRFIVQMTPYGQNPITAIFDTTGLSNALVPLMEACKWSID